MLFITDNEFERVVSRARNRDIAREYYRRDYVVNVSITTDNRGYYHISGKVMINGNIYLPRVLVNPNSKIVSTDCKHHVLKRVNGDMQHNDEIRI